LFLRLVQGGRVADSAIEALVNRAQPGWRGAAVQPGLKLGELSGEPEQGPRPIDQGPDHRRAVDAFEHDPGPSLHLDQLKNLRREDAPLVRGPGDAGLTFRILPAAAAQELDHPALTPFVDLGLAAGGEGAMINNHSSVNWKT